MIIIRQEQPQDYEAIYELVKTAFATAEHSDGSEQDLVVRLRGSANYIPDLALVATDGPKILGYILFTAITIGSSRSVAPAPLAVHPGYQKSGIGSMLIVEGHKLAVQLGYEFSVLVGSEDYYPRFGYRPASEFGISSPFELPECNHMALSLQPTYTNPNATVEYAPEFFEA